MYYPLVRFRGPRLFLAAFLVVVSGTALFLRPPAPRLLPPAAQQPTLWRGAYHVHSTQSDGSGTPEAIATAAAAAGLDFVILTDHGDATRPPTPPRMVDGVLLIDAVEISTDDGHLVALDLPQAPYPLAGEGRAVLDDVHRLGGLGILAHPDSPRPALAWHDASVDADGYEWVNADTTWRSARAPRLLAHLLTYALNRAGTLTALARYPAALFAERDQPTRRPQLALAAIDAHARIGWQRGADPLDGGRTLAEFPSYRASLGTFGLVVPWLDGSPSGDASRDAVVVLHAIRHGLASTAVFSMASPAWLSLDVLEPAATATPGPDARGPATLAVRSNAPADAIVRVLRNGALLREASAAAWSLALEADAPPAIYRAEMWLPARRGWPALPIAVSAARGHNLPRAPLDAAAAGLPGGGPPAPADDRSVAVDLRGWHVEHDPASRATHDTGPPEAIAQGTLTLAPGARVSQFAALVADLAAPPPGASTLELDLSASAPMRLSIQLREPRPGEGLRWRHSAYVDQARRLVRLPVRAFRPVLPASGSVPLGRVHALLLVMDTVNARPGETRTVTVHAARWTTGQ